jgi:hypothetical protein
MSFFMRSIEAQRFVLVSECWMVATPSEAEGLALMASGETLETRDDRMEVVMMVGQDVSGETLTGMAMITRERGKPHLGALERRNVALMSAFAGLLRPLRETRH